MQQFENMDITRPTLLLDKNKCLANIDRMVRKAISNKVIFRPHFKTHQSLEIGRWFREAGVKCITVSSLQMARYFADDWDDVTVAFPVNLREFRLIQQLSEKLDLSLFVVNEEAVTALEKSLKNPVGVFIKIDAGYHRTGIEWDDFDQLDRMAEILSHCQHLQMKGFAIHSGHTYTAGSAVEIQNIHLTARARLLTLKTRYEGAFGEMLLSVGDTPGMSLAENFNGIDEVRPGNFVFYDLMQSELGSCDRDDIAVALACPVVDVHHARRQLVIYGGAVHLSKDSMVTAKRKEPIFGLAVPLTDNGWEFPPDDNYVIRLSQEHGIIEATEQMLHQCPPGSVVGIIPVHSCLTADITKNYLTLDGEKIDKMNGG